MSDAAFKAERAACEWADWLACSWYVMPHGMTPDQARQLDAIIRCAESYGMASHL